MTIYAIKAPDKPEYVDLVFDSLNSGEGRFGWSYVPTADQRELHDRVKRNGWGTLTEKEQDCYHDFLLRLKPGDYVVYINVPNWGKCTLAKVTSEYYWRYEGDDFSHRFSVDPASVRTFDRNKGVHPTLSARLKLQGRWWTIYTEPEFARLLESLNNEVPASKTNLEHLAEDLQAIWPTISEKIQWAYPRKDLECLLEKLFCEVPGVRKVERRQGRADHGADLIVEFEMAVPELVQTLVVQVKSFTGEINDTSAIKDIRRAFEYHESASMGLIVSTATSASKSFRDELDRLRDESKKPVALLIGSDLATFFLRYGATLIC